MENRLNSAFGGMLGEKLEIKVFEPSYFQKFLSITLLPHFRKKCVLGFHPAV